MTMVQDITAASDRVMAALSAGLELEFGRGAGAALASRFLEAEEADFIWDARVGERWLGEFEAADDDGIGLDRIAIWGRLDGEWFAATCIVDGDGNAHGLTARRIWPGADEARQACADAR